MEATGDDTAVTTLVRAHAAREGSGETGGGDQEPTRLSPSMMLDGYALLCPIERGGMGEIWVAERIGRFGFRTLVAVKAALPNLLRDPTARSLFVDEAYLASRVHHVNVVEALDLVNVGDTMLLVMSYVDGVSLHRWLATKQDAATRLPHAVALRLVKDILSGLGAAHEATDGHGERLGILHRDVSPHNVIVGVDGIARLSDFGISVARSWTPERSAHQVAVSGKRRYLAPEIIDHPARTSVASDVYSAGVILWELLHNRQFDGAVTPRIVNSATTNISRPLAALTRKALAARPEDRFGSALEMRAAIEDLTRRKRRLDASYGDVASSLDSDLGLSIQHRREVIQSLRRQEPMRPQRGELRVALHHAPPRERTSQPLLSAVR